MNYTYYESPIGRLCLLQDHDTLRGLWIVGEKHAFPVEQDWRKDDTAFANLRRQLDAYFAGSLREFNVKFDAKGTDFQRKVWAALCEIPYGKTWSYGQLAAHIGRSAAVRAVGGANGRNPISIIVPCHRVIGANGSLTGYGGGLAAKTKLLNLESNQAQLPIVAPIGP